MIGKLLLSRNTFSLAAVCLSITMTTFGMAQAQTPDSETPSHEGICDMLIGGSPGLYGLCVAYCEAQDFDQVNTDDPQEVAKAIPNEKILTNYRKKMQPGDPDMPCLVPPPECPCWTEEQIARIGLQTDPYVVQCEEKNTRTSIVDLDFAGHSALFSVWIYPTVEVCGFVNHGPHPSFPTDTNFGTVVSPEDADICRASIRAAAERGGYVCSN